jgi:citrate lyase subunit beta/citryl-CoA lyase
MSDIRDSFKAMASLQTARSFLFAPGSEERKLVRALESGADAVVADLEDAVAPAEKAAARDLATRLMTVASPGPVRLVRVNGAGTEWHDGDLAAVAGSGIDGVVLPKATAAAVSAVGDRLGLPIVAIVETARGLREGFEIGSDERVSVLLLGAVDLGLELGLEPRADGQEILFARSSLVVDSAAAGLRGPVDRVWVDVRDLDGLARDCEVARSLGFRGKALVHPDQVGPTHEGFAPSASELQRAREIVAAYERAVGEGRGVVALDGEMIDVPVVERARELLSETRSVLHAE